MMEHAGDLMADLLMSGNELQVTGTETTFEVDFSIFRIKRTIKKGK
jgi:hypothetical protein